MEPGTTVAPNEIQSIPLSKQQLSFEDRPRICGTPSKVATQSPTRARALFKSDCGAFGNPQASVRISLAKRRPTEVTDV